MVILPKECRMEFYCKYIIFNKRYWKYYLYGLAYSVYKILMEVKNICKKLMPYLSIYLCAFFLHAQWPRFSKNLQQLIIFYSRHIFSGVKFDGNPNLERNIWKKIFRAQIGLFMVLTTMTTRTKIPLYTWKLF